MGMGAFVFIVFLTHWIHDDDHNDPDKIDPMQAIAGPNGYSSKESRTGSRACQETVCCKHVKIEIGKTFVTHHEVGGNGQNMNEIKMDDVIKHGNSPEDLYRL